jgi:hypothetical protein
MTKLSDDVVEAIEQVELALNDCLLAVYNESRGANPFSDPISETRSEFGKKLTELVKTIIESVNNSVD